MSDAQIAAHFAEALNAAARAERAGAKLVSMEITLTDDAALGEIRARVARQTRTLMFVEAELFSATGSRIAAASSVHKIAE